MRVFLPPRARERERKTRVTQMPNRKLPLHIHAHFYSRTTHHVSSDGDARTGTTRSIRTVRYRYASHPCVRDHRTNGLSSLLTDRSGRISKTELQRVLRALNIKANESELQQLMTQMDSDNSGEIDFQEFKRVMAGSFFKKHSKQELHAAFKKFDADGNNFITSAELNYILTRMGRQLSRTDIDAMVQSLDSSGDGKISFEEFCKLFD